MVRYSKKSKLRALILLNESYQNVFLCMALSPVLWFLPSVIIKFDESIPHYRRKQRAQAKGENIHTKWYKKFMWLYQAPVTVFWINLLFYYIFLGFFAFVITGSQGFHSRRKLCSFHKLKYSWKEFIFYSPSKGVFLKFHAKISYGC